MRVVVIVPGDLVMVMVMVVTISAMVVLMALAIGWSLGTKITGTCCGHGVMLSA